MTNSLLLSFGWAQLLALLLGKALLGRLPESKRSLAAGSLFGICWGLMLLPLGTQSPGAVLSGIFGQLSISSLLLLAWFLARIATPITAPARAEKLTIFGLFTVAGWAFYSLALGLELGLGSLDVYGWGYEGLAMPLVLTLLVLWAWLGRWPHLAMLLFVPLLAWHFGLLGSNNLWDYLLDPFLVLGSSLWLARTLFRTLFKTG